MIGCQSLLFTASLVVLPLLSASFVAPSSLRINRVEAPSETRRWMGEKYVPQYEDQPIRQTKKLYPQAGDIVRFYDIDGGKEDGEVLVGKIAFIQKQLGTEQWMVEIAELEDVGDGYYADYSSRQRQRKKTMRNLQSVAPISASYVRSENAFKVPRQLGTNLPLVRAEQYDLEGYEGPFSGANTIDESVLAQDFVTYSKLKGRLLKQAAITGAIGTVVTSIAKGTEDAVVYFAGALAGVLYLFFLSIKTDSIASAEAKLGKNIANVRFAMPLIVFVIVALYNKSLGDANPVIGKGLLSTVTPEQFACISIGFLTYRIPLFADQISEFLGDPDNVPLGSAAIAMKLAKKDADDQISLSNEEDLIPILLVSGPQAAGRTELVQKLVEESNGRFVLPERVDRIKEGARFEQMEARKELLSVDSSGRYGFTKDGIFKAAADKTEDSVVVVDADVKLAKKLTTLSGTRLIGVWVGLDATDKFNARLEAQIENGELEIPKDETKESFLRAKIKEIVKDIEYGLVSGIFEFTILNDDVESSMAQLRSASEYCFK